MTCVVGIADGKTVWMGADTLAVAGWDKRTSLVKKVFVDSGFIVGYTSSFRMGQILQYHIDWKDLRETYINTKDKLGFMITNLIPEVREQFKELGFSKMSDNEEEGGTFMIGVDGKLFTIHKDFQVQEFEPHQTDNPHPDLAFDAIGCGEDFAKGALQAYFVLMYDTNNIIHPLAMDRIISLAIRSASMYSIEVNAHNIVLNVGDV